MRIFTPGLLVLLSIVILEPSRVSDPVAAILSQARADYETRMQGLREETLRAINKKADAGARPGAVDANLVREAGAEKDAFRRTGEWPKVGEAPALKARAAHATKEMKDAYARAIAAYTKLDDADRRDGVAAELDLFETHRDLVPWGEDLVASVAAERRTIGVGGEPVTLVARVAGEYRLDLVGKAGEDPATVEVVYPNAEGAFESVSVSAAPRMTFRLLLTIRNDAVSADLGMARPAEFSEAASEPDTGVIVATAKAGSITLTSARIKPVIDGVPDEPTPASAPAQRPAVSGPPKSNPGGRGTEGDPLPVQSVWRGRDRREGRTYSCVVRVSSRAEGGLAVLHVGHGNKAWDMDVRLKNGQFEITGVRPGNGVAAAIRDAKGTGSVKGGDMLLSYSWLQDLPSQGRMGNPVNGTIEVHRDDDP